MEAEETYVLELDQRSDNRPRFSSSKHAVGYGTEGGSRFYIHRTRSRRIEYLGSKCLVVYLNNVHCYQPNHNRCARVMLGARPRILAKYREESGRILISWLSSLRFLLATDAVTFTLPDDVRCFCKARHCLRLSVLDQYTMYSCVVLLCFTVPCFMSDCKPHNPNSRDRAAFPWLMCNDMHDASRVRTMNKHPK